MGTMCTWMDEYAVRRWREALEFVKNGDKTDAGIFFRSETSILTFLREIKKHLYCTHLYYLGSLITPVLWKSLPIVFPLAADQYGGFFTEGRQRVESAALYHTQGQVMSCLICCLMLYNDECTDEGTEGSAGCCKDSILLRLDFWS